MTVREGAFIDASTLGIGKGGNVALTADNIFLDNSAISALRS
jgi:large exoprotein involved in heme utilization and adhesion